MTGPPRPARIALVVANPGVIDARIAKCVTCLVEAGYAVRVLAHSPDERRHELDAYGARYVQLPVPAPGGRGGRTVGRIAGRIGRVARRRADALVTRGEEGGSDGPVRRTELRAYRRWPALAAWRRVCRTSVAMRPVLWAELDAFDPDLVYQHDVHELNATATWVAHRRALGRPVGYLYDAREYVIGQPVPPARSVAAYAAMEHEFIGLADRIMTVSEPIADQLVRDHALARRPDLLPNATYGALDPHSRLPAGGATVRSRAGLDPAVPLLVYAGGLAPARGVHTVVEALRRLPDVHLAVVARAGSSYTRHLASLAEALGLGDRLHVVGFVEPFAVVAYLRGCDLGLSPLLHAPNHDWALTNKFFEYVQAGIPVVTSDTPVQADLVRDAGIGTVFRAGDVGDCAAAIRRALDRLPQLRAAVSDPDLVRRLSWPAVSTVLLRSVAEVLADAFPEGLPETPPEGLPETPPETLPDALPGGGITTPGTGGSAPGSGR